MGQGLPVGRAGGRGVLSSNSPERPGGGRFFCGWGQSHGLCVNEKKMSFLPQGTGLGRDP